MEQSTRNCSAYCLRPRSHPLRHLGAQIRKIPNNASEHMDSALLCCSSFRRPLQLHVQRYLPLVHGRLAAASPRKDHPRLCCRVDSLWHRRYSRDIHCGLADSASRGAVDPGHRISLYLDVQPASSHYARPADILGPGLSGHRLHGSLSRLCLRRRANRH